MQAAGPVEFFDDRARLLRLVTRLTRQHEQGRERPWAVADAPADYIAAMLNGIGFVFIARLADVKPEYEAQARIQSLWVAIAVAVFVAVLVLVPDVRVFERYRYTALVLGLAFLLLPLAPIIGESRGGGRLWIVVGPLSFQPSEVAKVLLVAFFAS